MEVRKKAQIRYGRVPILTEEYAIHVYVGPLHAVKRVAERRLAQRYGLRVDLQDVTDQLRGIAWNCLPEHSPIIAVRTGLPKLEALATLAHEASHAAGFFAAATGLDDPRGEFRAHAISAVLRVAGKLIRGV